MILTADQFRVAECDCGVAINELIARAGRAVVDEILLHFSKRRVLVLCGPGNNGKDGAVVAELLKGAGWLVEVVRFDHGDAFLECMSLVESGDVLVVDAVFGIGLSRAIKPDLCKVFRKINASSCPVVSVDLPSGINSDTGEIMGEAIESDLTITFSCLKFGHVISPGRYHSGKVCVADIGIVVSDKSEAWQNSPAMWAKMIPRPNYMSHKYSRGYVLVYSLGSKSVGAVKLAAAAALRSGPGAVAVVCCEDEIPLYASVLTSVMYKLRDEVIDDARVTAILIGPGGDVGDQLRECTLQVLVKGKRCVLDAGSISAFQYCADTLFAAIQGNDVVMTPHEGEFQRIFPGLRGSVVDRAKSAAKLSGAVVVLKGHDTVIAAPDGKIAINNNAPCSLATAGSGDVLSGIITGLMAGGMPSFLAACCGVWVHGECGGKSYRFGVIADDIVQQIPRVLSTLI